MARQSKKWILTARDRQRVKNDKIVFSMPDFSRYVAQLEKHDDLVRTMLGDRSILEIAYEDLDAELPVIQKRLGVKVLKMRSGVRKQNSGNWIERFQNPECVLRGLESTRFANHLREYNL